MCRQVLLPTGPLGCVADLRDAGFDIPPGACEPDQADDWCLCGVDVVAVLDANGATYAKDYLGDYVVTP